MQPVIQEKSSNIKALCKPAVNKTAATLMFKKSIAFFLCLISYMAAFSQNAWYDVGGGANAGVVLIRSDTVNNKLYLAGGGGSVGYNNLVALNAASWDGSQFHVLGCPNGQDLMSSGDYNGIVYNGRFIIGYNYAIAHHYCNFDQILSKFQYNGFEWDTLGTQLFSNRINCIVSYMGHVVIGGEIAGAVTATGQSVVNNIAELDSNGFWKPIGNISNPGVIYTGIAGMVFDAIEFNSELFLSGRFDYAGGMPLTNFGNVRWNGQNWLNSGITTTGIGRFVIYNNELYMAQSEGTILYKWNGADWNIFAIVDSTGRIYEMADWDNKLVVTGGFDGINGVAANNIAYWDGNQWQPLGSGLSLGGDPYLAQGNSLAVFQGSLYVAGSFDSAGGVSVNNLARYGAVQKVSEHTVTEFNIYPNPIAGNCIYFSEPVVNSTLSIISITGIPIINIAHFNGDNFTLPAPLPAGIYLLALNNSKTTIIKKLIIQ
jgi:trimeric autotransporter adhesin